MDTLRTVLAGVTAAIVVAVLAARQAPTNSSPSLDGWTYLEVEYCRDGLRVDGEPWWSDDERAPLRSGRRIIECGDGSTHEIFVEEGRVFHFDGCYCGP